MKAPAKPRSFRITDDLYTQGQLAADFLEVYLSDAVRTGIEDLITRAKSSPDYRQWLAEHAGPQGDSK